MLSVSQPLQDWMLLLGVLVLVAIDVGILLVYDVVEGSRGNLGATRFPNKEHLNDLQGVSVLVKLELAVTGV